MDKLQSKGVLRLDKWLWYARFMKSRSKATKFCQSSRFRVNGSIVVKANCLVKQLSLIHISEPTRPY